MSYEIRPVTEEEFPGYPKTFGIAFGFQPQGENLEDWRALTELERTLCAFEKGTIVATAGAFTFDELTVPGGGSVPAAGVNAVSVRATHRRRGILTSIMRKQLEDVRDRGESVAILMASEAIIYGRFGYGWANSHIAYEVETAHGAFARPLEDLYPASRAGGPGRLVQLELDDAAKVIPGVYDRARRQRAGEVSRSPKMWDGWFLDRPWHQEGASKRFYAIHESAKGKADGYVTYRIKDEWRHQLPGNELRVVELMASDPVAYAALWRYLLDFDLVGKVNVFGQPVDDPLRWMLADPRRMRATVVGDFLWLRIVDVAHALAARRYAVDGSVVLDVVDDFNGMATGRFLVEGGPAGATCVPTKRKPHIALGVADLGAMYLGGTSARALALAGRVDERARDGIARADALFAAQPAPVCHTHF